MRVNTTASPSGKTAPIAKKVAMDNGGMYAITILLTKNGLGVQSWGRTKEYDRLAQTLALGMAEALNEIGSDVAATEEGTARHAPTGNDKVEEQER